MVERGPDEGGGLGGGLHGSDKIIHFAVDALVINTIGVVVFFDQGGTLVGGPQQLGGVTLEERAGGLRTVALGQAVGIGQERDGIDTVAERGRRPRAFEEQGFEVGLSRAARGGPGVDECGQGLRAEGGVAPGLLHHRFAGGDELGGRGGEEGVERFEGLGLGLAALAAELGGGRGDALAVLVRRTPRGEHLGGGTQAGVAVLRLVAVMPPSAHAATWGLDGDRSGDGLDEIIQRTVT